MNVYNLDELNNWWHKSNNVRNYQYLIVSQETFFLEFKNNKYEFYQSKVENNTNTLIFKDLNSNNFYKLKSQDCANGFSLINQLEKQSLNFSKYDKVVVHAGQYNFAHFIWNELSALFLLFHKRNFYFTYNKAHESFLNFENFLDPKFKKYKLDKNFVQNPDHNFLKVGGTYICKKISSSLNGLFKNNIRPKKFFYLYIGVKGYNKQRCIINEFEFYKELMSQLSKSIPNIFFIIDGFSFLNNIHKNTSYFSDHYDQSQEIINKLLGFFKHNKINFKVINGYSLHKSLEIIKLTDFYITHEGTMHHKINWFFPQKKGFMITGSSFSLHAGMWHSAQCYGALTPFLFKEIYITRLSEPMYNKYLYYFFKLIFNIVQFVVPKEKRKIFHAKLNKRRDDRNGVFLLNDISSMIKDICYKINN